MTGSGPGAGLHLGHECGGRNWTSSYSRKQEASEDLRHTVREEILGVPEAAAGKGLMCSLLVKQETYSV